MWKKCHCPSDFWCKYVVYIVCMKFSYIVKLLYFWFLYIKKCYWDFQKGPSVVSLRGSMAGLGDGLGWQGPFLPATGKPPWIFSLCRNKQVLLGCFYIVSQSVVIETWKPLQMRISTCSEGAVHSLTERSNPDPPGFHWDDTDDYMFIPPPCFADLWGCVNFYLFRREFPFLWKCCSCCTSEFSLSPAPPGQDVPLPRWDVMASSGCFGLVFTLHCSHWGPHSKTQSRDWSHFSPSYKSSL